MDSRMSNRAALDRLSDIAKVRTIRQPLLIPVPGEGFPSTEPATKVEWPVPR
jgi:hypothetical protein